MEVDKWLPSQGKSLNGNSFGENDKLCVTLYPAFFFPKVHVKLSRQ